MHWSIRGIGSSCFASCTDGSTVLKGYQVWEDGKLCAWREESREDVLAREALIYEHLDEHPRILRYLGQVEIYPNVHSLRLELAPLGNVRQYIQEHLNQPPPELTRLRMALDTAVGLSYIHSKKVQHSDLSCRNLFLFSGHRVKIGDFGGSMLEGHNFEETVSEEIRYELPCRGRNFRHRPVISREIFALGSAIYEIMTWKTPYQGLSDDEVEIRYSRDEFPSLEGISVGPIIQNCWNEKYKNTDQVVDELRESVRQCKKRFDKTH